MVESLKDIIIKSDDLNLVSVYKPKRHDRSSWVMDVLDKKSPMCGEKVLLGEKDFRIVTLRRGDHFFQAYKLFKSDGTFEYYIDPRKSNHRKTIRGYVDSVKNYVMNSNDISLVKNANSFKVTDIEMRNLGIDNFVELCYQFKEYSAIGIGVERIFRNMIVLDIDVDCYEEENAEELNRILLLFANSNILPDFEIHNNANGHVQLQWLIKSLRIKNISDYAVTKLIEEITEDTDKNKEINHLHYNFSEDTSDCGEYILFTRALTDISDKEKFGDKNFTFWKAKNFCTALFGLYNLKLKMPYYRCGKIYYMADKDMMDLFSTKESRHNYYEESPTFQQIKDNSKSLMEKYVETEKPNLSRIKNEVKEKYNETYSYRCDSNEESRNNFVLSYTRTTTWDVCRKMMLKSYEDINNLGINEYRKFENKVKNLVKKEFKRKDEEYKGHWPGTSNNSMYTQKEFEMTFNAAFEFAKMKYTNSKSFSNDNRNKSIVERSLKKDMKIVVVDYFRTNYDMKREELLCIVNMVLKESGKKEISLTSLKRYINISKGLNEKEREELYRYYINNIDIRKDNLLNSNSKNSKYVNVLKKKLDSISINIIDDIMKSIDL